MVAPAATPDLGAWSPPWPSCPGAGLHVGPGLTFVCVARELLGRFSLCPQDPSPHGKFRVHSSQSTAWAGPSRSFGLLFL